MANIKFHWPAVLVSALAIYTIGFALYGFLFSEAWLMWSGYTEEGLASESWRVAFSPIMPLLLAAGVGAVLHWVKPADLSAALMLGFMIWLLLLLPTRLYAWAYGDQPLGLLLLDGGHLLANVLVAAGIQQAWPKKSVLAPG